MKKSDGEIHEKTASWGILQSEWLRKCGRLLLLLLYRFVIGWAFFQLLAMIVAGIFLLGILLFHPIIFVQTIAITEKLNHASLIYGISLSYAYGITVSSQGLFLWRSVR